MNLSNSELLPHSETVMTMDGPKKGCYVIVYNKNNYGPSIRHIITNTIDGTLSTFKDWYYSEYEKLVGDEFIVCSSRDERDKYIKKLKEED